MPKTMNPRLSFVTLGVADLTRARNFTKKFSVYPV